MNIGGEREGERESKYDERTNDTTLLKLKKNKIK